MNEPRNKSEAARLRQVYAGYEDIGRGSTVWNPQNPGNRAIVAERRRVTAELLRRQGIIPASGLRVLEIGCGGGGFLADLLELGFAPTELHAVDLLEDRVEEARHRFPEIDVRCANAEHLEFPDHAFDLVVMTTVFSSIFDEGMATRVAAEAARLLPPGGCVLWYDMRYNNPANRHTRAVRRAEMTRLFPGFEMDLQTVTVWPHLVRRLNGLTAALYPWLASIRPLRTHLIGLLEKPAS